MFKFWVFCVHVCLRNIFVPDRRGCQIPWDWRYRGLWVALLGLGIKFSSSVKKKMSALNLIKVLMSALKLCYREIVYLYKKNHILSLSFTLTKYGAHG